MQRGRGGGACTRERASTYPREAIASSSPGQVKERGPSGSSNLYSAALLSGKRRSGYKQCDAPPILRWNHDTHTDRSTDDGAPCNVRVCSRTGQGLKGQPTTRGNSTHSCTGSIYRAFCIRYDHCTTKPSVNYDRSGAPPAG